MIFSHLWIKQYRVLLDIINNFIIFFQTYFDIFLFFTSSKLKKTKIIPKAKYENIILD